MAHVAFDLDNTLGYFETVGPLAYFFSPEFLSNPEERVGNSLALSRALIAKLAHVRKVFAASLLKHPELLKKVLRPNVDVLIKPILKAKREKPVTVIIYSNTGNSFSTHLARDLIEMKFKCPGLFSLIADVFHPLREPETRAATPGANGFANPEKTVPVLMRLLQEGARRRSRGDHGYAPIHPETVAFVDDRTPVHRIAEAIPLGLTYIKPTQFAPKQTTERRGILTLALEAMDAAGLLSNDEYLASAICHRRIGRKIIRGFPDLFSYVWEAMNESYIRPKNWVDDTFTLESRMRGFFSQR
jgi:hypothetical protein